MDGVLAEISVDLVFLHDLTIETIIGVFDWERQIKQAVVIDLDMASNTKRAAASDCVGDALDYKAVAKRLIDFVEGSQFQLVETLAEHIAEILLVEFRVPWVRVRVNKQGAVRGARDVGVIIERGRAT